MIRGTTPTHTFKLPFDTSMVKDVRITYAQDGVVVAEKLLADCTLQGTEIITKLTQEETLKFYEKRQVDLQLRVLTTTGDAMATPIYSIPARDVLNEEVLE